MTAPWWSRHSNRPTEFPHDEAHNDLPPCAAHTASRFKRPLACLTLSACLALPVAAAPVSLTVTDEGWPPTGQRRRGGVRQRHANDYIGRHGRDGTARQTICPQLVVIQTGSAVQFPNFDTIRHHVYSFSAIKPFEIKLYSGRPSAPVVFDRPAPPPLGCNIHDSMVGYIHVVDTPYFGVSNAQGKVELELPQAITASGSGTRRWAKRNLARNSVK